MKHAQIVAALLLTLSVACGIPTADDYDCGLGIQGEPNCTTMDITWFAKKDHYYFVKQTSDLRSKEWTYFPYAVKGSDGPEGIEIESNNDLMLFRLVYTENPASDLLEIDLDGDFIRVADELDYGLDPFENSDINTNSTPDDWENTLYNGTMPPDADFDGDRLSDSAEFAQNRNPANFDQDSDGNLDYIYLNDLIAWWNFESINTSDNSTEVLDLSPNSNTAVINDHLAIIKKSGLNSYLYNSQNSHTGTFNFSFDETHCSENFTISTWVKAYHASNRWLIFQLYESNFPEWTYQNHGFLYKGENEQMFYLHGNESPSFIVPELGYSIYGEQYLLTDSADQMPTDDKWHHLAFSFSPAIGDPALASASYYLDGQLISSVPNLAPVNFNNRNTLSFTFSGFFVDDVAIINRALNANEIAQIANGLQHLPARLDTTPPTTPSVPTFTADYPNDCARVSWAPSTDETRLNGYILTRNNKPYCFSKTPKFSDFQLEGSYDYALQAFDYDLNLTPSVNLGTYSKNTPPAAPTLSIACNINGLNGLNIDPEVFDFGVHMTYNLIIEPGTASDNGFVKVFYNGSFLTDTFKFNGLTIPAELGEHRYHAFQYDLHGAASPQSNITTVNVIDLPEFTFTAADYPLHNFMTSATTRLDPEPAITLSWPTDVKHANYLIYRKAPNESDWEYRDTVKTPVTQYTDTDVTLGQIYEYQIARVYVSYSSKTSNTASKSYLTAAIEAPLVDQRGGVLLVIDDTVAESLRPEIDRLKSDLTGDGWASVAEVLVPRHAPAYSGLTDPKANALYAERVQLVKDAILNHYNSDPVPLQSVILLGRVPVPFSGFKAWDGHSDKHTGAWPADTYYADITRLPDEDDWTDSLNLDPTISQWAHNRNLAGDGKFDNNSTPSALELAIGRIDLAGLAEFAAPEVELLRNYLNKDHDFRHARLTAREKGIIDTDYAFLSNDFFAPAFTSFAALFGHSNVESSNRDGADYFGSTVPDLNGESYLFGYGTGRGVPQRSFELFNGRTAATPLRRDPSYISPHGETTDFADHDPQIMFSMLFGSYFGDWYLDRCFLRAPLAADTYGLSCIWAANGSLTDGFYCHRLALGDTLGESLLLSQNDRTVYGSGAKNTGAVIFNLMGDPTLRVFVCPPPQNPATTTTVDAVTLTWQAPAQPAANFIGYHIYRKTDGSYQRLTPDPISELIFTDNNLSSGNHEYMIRSIELRTTGSGSFYNASQAAFATATIP